MDRIQLVIDPKARVRWPEGGGFQPVQVFINDRPLLELVREAEEPWVRAENAERRLDPSDSYVLPSGDYLYLPARVVTLPSKEWFGSPRDPGFVLKADDPCRGKAMVLGCTCGISECWFVQVRIDILPDVVRWSEFGQFHRPQWEYGFGPFVFDRGQYEAELSQTLTGGEG